MLINEGALIVDDEYEGEFHQAEKRHELILQSRGRRALTICDGLGGALSFDLGSGEVSWLVDAFRRLLNNGAPQNVSAIKVRSADRWYLLSRGVSAQAQGATLRVMNLFDPAEQVTLTPDLATLVSSLLEQALSLNTTTNVVQD